MLNLQYSTKNINVMYVT